ncbi:hypothetical protein CDAR_532281 [Caerostris darwini]|uniref:Uncharacterized protein n=1 Tax=Caerostris darwini TaxID=1538125 RepID=A0AAV4UQ84_9ARAC|nr:hypothetical protein CDAR_532281 [Caerostris darwini]
MADPTFDGNNHSMGFPHRLVVLENERPAYRLVAGQLIRKQEIVDKPYQPTPVIDKKINQNIFHHSLFR